MARSYPPDVLVLDSEALIHARVVKSKRGLSIQHAKSYRIPAETIVPAVVTPQIGNEAALAEVLRRLDVLESERLPALFAEQNARLRDVRGAATSKLETESAS